MPGRVLVQALCLAPSWSQLSGPLSKSHLPQMQRGAGRKSLLVFVLKSNLGWDVLGTVPWTIDCSWLLHCSAPSSSLSGPSSREQLLPCAPAVMGKADQPCLVSSGQSNSREWPQELSQQLQHLTGLKGNLEVARLGISLRTPAALTGHPASWRVTSSSWCAIFTPVWCSEQGVL